MRPPLAFRLLPFAFCLLPCLVSAQDLPVFRSGVDLVRLDIRVLDAQGRPIGDLRPDEVQIVDGGERRSVLLLQHIAESGRSHFEAIQRTVAAEVSTNQGSPRGQLYVLMFDQHHLTPGTEQRARHAAETFLRQHLRPQDRVAVYGLPIPGPSQPFTSNVTTAIAQLQHVRGGLERMVTGAIGDMTVHEAYQIVRGNAEVLSRFTVPSPGGSAVRTSALADETRGGESREMLQRVVRENAQLIVGRADQEARQFLQLAAAVLRTLRSIDGRKTVLLFTEGFHPDNVAQDVQDVAAAAAESYSVIYTIDLNRRTENYGAEPTGNDQASEVATRLEPVGSLAVETNGAVILDALSHLNQALNTLSDVNGDYYIVGFTPGAEALANRGSYRPVEVHVTRRGATVSTRTGYVASPASSPANRRRAIDAALAGPFSQQGLRLEYTTYVSGSDPPGPPRVIVSLEAELPVAPGDVFAPPPADVVFVVRDSHTGQVAASGTDQIALPRAASPGSSTGRSSWRVQFALSAGDYLMRCVVREPGGLVGSADRQFTVRSLTGPDIASSDLVLGAPGIALPVRAQAFRDSPFSGVVRVYARATDQLAQLDGRLEIVPLGADAPVLTVAGTTGEARASATAAQVLRDVLFDIPLGNVPEGEYVARAVVRARGEVVADLRRQVVVSAGVAPPASRTMPPSPRRPREVLAGLIGQRLVARAAKNDDAVIFRGLALLGEERYRDAAVQLGEAFDARPDDAALAFVLGWARIGAGDQTGAITAFRNAAVLEPPMLPAHLALAETYISLNQRALAVQALQAGLTTVPDAPELKRMLEAIRK